MGSWGKFIKAVAKGEWKLSTWTILGAVGALIYTITPIDFISEAFIPFVGFIDDLGFWGVVSVLVGKEKSRWEQTLKSGAIEVEPN